MNLGRTVSTKIKLEVTKGQLENEREKLEKQATFGKVMASQLKGAEIKHNTLEKKAKEINDDLKDRDSKIESLSLFRQL